jgi:hypothetical protein
MSFFSLLALFPASKSNLFQGTLFASFLRSLIPVLNYYQDKKFNILSFLQRFVCMQRTINFFNSYIDLNTVCQVYAAHRAGIQHFLLIVGRGGGGKGEGGGLSPAAPLTFHP